MGLQRTSSEHLTTMPVCCYLAGSLATLSGMLSTPLPGSRLIGTMGGDGQAEIPSPGLYISPPFPRYQIHHQIGSNIRKLFPGLHVPYHIYINQFGPIDKKDIG